MSTYDLPKFDLHLHLDGSLLPETAWELVQEQGVPVEATTLEEFIPLIMVPKGCRDVNQCLERFEIPVKIMQEASALERITKELIDWLAETGIAYGEIRFAPQLHTQKEMTQKDAIEAVLSGLHLGLAANPEIKIGIILCAMSIGPETINMEANLETVRLTKEYLGKGVVALDLAGAEGIVPLSNFAPVFDLAKELDLPRTCHAGDSQGPDTVSAALDFGVTRVGHGHHIYEDLELCQRAKDLGIVFEVCPTSNVCCQTTENYNTHYMKRMYDFGLQVTVNTDNMTLFGIDINDEYDRCLEMGFTYDDLKKMIGYAIKGSFMPEEDKAAFMAKLG